MTKKQLIKSIKKARKIIAKLTLKFMEKEPRAFYENEALNSLDEARLELDNAISWLKL